MLVDAKWSRGDSAPPARAHKVRVVFNVPKGDCDRKFVHLISLVLSIVFDYCTHQSWIARSRHLIDI